MALRDALVAARGHLAWILALVVSAAIIVWLEVTGPAPFSRPAAESTGAETALAAARGALAADPANPAAQTRLLVALTLTALEGGTDDAMREEALALRDALAGETSDTVRAAVDLAGAVFGER